MLSFGFPLGAADKDDSFVYLKLVPTAVTVKKEVKSTVTVTDRRAGKGVENASFGGAHTDAKGEGGASSFPHGVFSSSKPTRRRATVGTNVRSNVVNVAVTK